MTLRAALAAIPVAAGLLMSGPAIAADPTIDQLLATSPDQIRSAFERLPPEVQDRIREQIRSKSPEELMSMSPDQLRSALQGLSPDAKAQLKAQWASMPADQKAALKSLNLKALWQQAIARFQAMGPTERAIVQKLLGQAVGTGNGPRGQP